MTPFGNLGSGLPFEQPPPAITAYRLLPERSSSPLGAKATLATPIWSPPSCVSDEGSPSATVVRVPAGLMREIRAVMLLLTGPSGGGSCRVGHRVSVVVIPVRPASAT